jgi:uncharacterized protein YfdQ (DUF2303 family)
MLTLEVIEALREAKVTRDLESTLDRNTSDRNAMVVPNTHQIVNIEQYKDGPARRVSAVAMTDVESFATYVKAHRPETSQVFVDSENLKVEAILDYWRDYQPVIDESVVQRERPPGHAQNTAVLTLKPTAEYQSFLAVCRGIQLSQTEAAEYVEDWANSIQSTDGWNAAFAKRLVSAIRSMTIEALRKVETEQQSLSASQTAFESVKVADSENKLPDGFVQIITPSEGLNHISVFVRISVITADKTPKIVFRPAKLQGHQVAIAKDLASKVREELPGYSVLIGKLVRGQR